MTTRQDLILATIRTGVPAAVGAFIAWLVSRIPTVGDFIVEADKVLAEVVPGATVVALLGAACIGLTTAAYYYAVRELGKRWPIVERFLLGSSRQPMAYTPPVSGR